MSFKILDNKESSHLNLPIFQCSLFLDQVFILFFLQFSRFIYILPLLFELMYFWLSLKTVFSVLIMDSVCLSPSWNNYEDIAGLVLWIITFLNPIITSSSFSPVYSFYLFIYDFPGGTVVKNPPANARDVRDLGSTPESGRCPGGGNGNPLQYSCLGNPVDRGAWWATAHSVAKSGTWLSMHDLC